MLQAVQLWAYASRSFAGLSRRGIGGIEARSWGLMAVSGDFDGGAEKNIAQKSIPGISVHARVP